MVHGSASGSAGTARLGRYDRAAVCGWHKPYRSSPGERGRQPQRPLSRLGCVNIRRASGRVRWESCGACAALLSLSRRVAPRRVAPPHRSRQGATPIAHPDRAHPRTAQNVRTVQRPRNPTSRVRAARQKLCAPPAESLRESGRREHTARPPAGRLSGSAGGGAQQQESQLQQHRDESGEGRPHRRAQQPAGGVPRQRLDHVAALARVELVAELAVVVARADARDDRHAVVAAPRREPLGLAHQPPAKAPVLRVLPSCLPLVVSRDELP
eukprot:1584916-Prymnesium_polylepis.1